MNPNNSWPPPPVRESAITPSQPLKDRKAAKYGWLGAGLAVGSLVFPTLIFVLWMNYMGSVLDHPDMDDWYTGNGRTDLHCCQIVIIGLELAALAFGIRVRRTVIGKIVFFIVAVALGFACKVWPDWYWVSYRFN